jgi:hypothetical protein
MSEYSRIMEGEFTSTGVAKFVQLPCLPRSFSLVNKTQYNSTTQDKVKEAFSYQDETALTAYITYNGAASSVANKTVITAGGLEWISAGEPSFGAAVTASGGNSVDKDADFMAVNITSHGFQTGDVVWLTGTTGMLQIAGLPFTVTRVNANQFTIPIDTSAYTFAADATAVSARKLLYADLYIPMLVVPVGITQATQAVVTTNVDHQFVVGQKVRFYMPQVESGVSWGMSALNGVEATVLSVGNIDNAESYTVATSGAVNAFRIDVDTSAYTAFDFPTSAQAVGSSQMQFPAVYSVGDRNSGYVFDGTSPLNRISGSFVANTRQGVNVGLGNGTQVIHVNNDVIHWRAELPDWYNA